MNLLLIVFDGLGMAKPGRGNAFTQAKPKTFSAIFKDYPMTSLSATGTAVGLPPGEIGNTEVGHLNLGAGRIVYQSLLLIDQAISDGGFFENEVLVNGVKYAKKKGVKVHLVGLVGEGSVHASRRHLFSLLALLKRNKLGKVFVHAITDGRDSAPKSAVKSLSHLQKKMTQFGVGEVSTVIGRYFAMDRDKRWERIEKSYRCLVKGEGARASTWAEAVEASYKKGKTDEFIEPTVIAKDGKVPGTIEKGDLVIFFNHRSDRLQELVRAFVLDDFKNDANKTSYDPFAAAEALSEKEGTPLAPPFKRGPKIKDLHCITLTEYERGLSCEAAYPQTIMVDTLGEVLADENLLQLRMAESEKASFVTYNFNGRRETEFDGEDRIIVASPKVATYDKKPEMSAPELTRILTSKMKSKKYQFILINFANCDMVGHTGNIRAAIAAVLALDRCLNMILDVARQSDYVVLITADHGNIEEMVDMKTGENSTNHSTNPVPFVVVYPKYKGAKLKSGILADVAPTILFILGIKPPSAMTGKNLLSY